MNRIAIYFLPIILLASACKKMQPKSDTNPESIAYKIVEIEDDWFQVSYLDPRTYIIEEPKSSQGNVSYMILGENKGIMFDTGSGENDAVNGFKIKYLTDQLTDLPIQLLLSHFHFDHNQNIAEFERVTFPDLPFLTNQLDVNNNYHFTPEDLFSGTFPEKVKVTDLLPVNKDIDLGDKIIQVINVPGHSTESVSIIDKTNKHAFLGDYLYNGQLFIFGENNLIPYQESIDYLISILDSEYKLFGAHGRPEVSFEKLQRLKDFLTCIENADCLPTRRIIWGEQVDAYSFEGMTIFIFV